MKTRVLTAVVALPLLFFFIYMQGWWLTALVFALTFVALFEYKYAVDKQEKHKISYPMLLLLSAAMLCVIKTDYTAMLPAAAITVMLCFTFEIFKKEPDFECVMKSAFGLLYIVPLFSFLMLFDYLRFGNLYIWMCFIAAFSTDTFAYLIGRRSHGRKLIQTVSPNKTVAGSVAGFVASGLCMMIYGWALGRFFSFNMPLYYYLILGAVASIAGQLGDLSASLIKRHYGVKDFGKILPGHGGILDRFDSLIFIIPVVWLFAVYTTG